MKLVWLLVFHFGGTAAPGVIDHIISLEECEALLKNMRIGVPVVIQGRCLPVYKAKL